MFLLLILLLSFTQNSRAQTTDSAETRYWKFITEKSMVDFFYRIADCENSKQLYLRVKNDFPKERTISFTVEITAPEKINKKISIDAAPVAILEPDCNNRDKNKILRIDLPPKFDVSALEVKINMHE